MIKPICERGKKCLFLTIEIRDYSYSLIPRSDYMVTGKEFCYFCNNPKKFKEWNLPKLLTHTEKFSACKYKVTDLLETFF